MDTTSNTLTAPDLGSVLAKTVSPSAWVEFKEGISFNLRFMPKSRFRSLAEKFTELVYNEKTKTRTPKLNSDEFTKAFFKEAILGWKGLTLRSLSRIAEIDVSDYAEEQLDVELPYNVDQLAKIVDMVYDLDTFLNESVMDIKTFRPNLEDEAKNSKSSPSTS